jgi:hypothetical protein
MDYEVREITRQRGRVLLGYAVHRVGDDRNAPALHSFMISPTDGPTGAQVAHYLACQMAHDLDEGIE